MKIATPTDTTKLIAAKAVDRFAFAIAAACSIASLVLRSEFALIASLVIAGLSLVAHVMALRYLNRIARERVALSVNANRRGGR